MLGRHYMSGSKFIKISMLRVFAITWPIRGVLGSQVVLNDRVARFFLVQNTKTGKNIPNYHELYQMDIKYNKWP
jgi:hypothetical protein